MAALSEVARPSYDELGTLVSGLFARQTDVYVARAGAEVAGFLGVRREDLEIGGRVSPSWYLAPGITADAWRGRGILRHLFGALIADVHAWEREHRERLLLWGRTTHPAMYLALEAQFAELEPRRDGSYSDFGRAFAAAVRRVYGLPDPPPGRHPFFLPAVARWRYTRFEHERAQSAGRRRGLDLLERLGVDERRGDRMALLFRAP